MKKKTVIAICGRASHGKDTTAKWFMDFLRCEKTKRVAFADALKNMGSMIFGWDGRKDERGRKFLQLLGTEVGRCYNNLIWVEKSIQTIKASPNEYFFITDLRFQHEYEAISELKDQDCDVYFVKVIKVTTFWDNFKWRVAKIFGKVHSSEVGLPSEGMDLLLSNDFKDASGIQADIKKFIESELGIVVQQMEEKDAE